MRPRGLDSTRSQHKMCLSLMKQLRLRPPKRLKCMDDLARASVGGPRPGRLGPVGPKPVANHLFPIWFPIWSRCGIFSLDPPQALSLDSGTMAQIERILQIAIDE